MHKEYYAAGSEDAYCDVGLEKQAFVGAALSAGRALLPKLPALARSGAKALGVRAGTKAIGAAGRAVGSRAGAAGKAVGAAKKQLYSKFAPVGESVERGITRGAERVLGKPGGQVAKKLVKGMPGQVASQAVGGAAGFGLLEGGLGAAMAEKGQGWDEFKRGLGHGALEGAAWGGLTGAMGTPLRNIRRSSLQGLAKSKGLPLKGQKALIDKQMHRGFFGSAKDLATGKGPLGRAGSAENMLGGIGQFGTDMILPMAILDSGSAQAPIDATSSLPATPSTPYASYGYPQYPSYGYPQYAKQGAAPLEEPTDTNATARVLSTLGGSVAGGLPAGLAVDALASQPWFPKGAKGSLLRRALPAIGATAGALGGHYLGQKYLPAPQPDEEIEQKLNQIDFDKLMRYYKKREATES